MTHFSISIVSDTVCPWCYVGWRRLLQAVDQHLAAAPADSFSVAWRPFQLNPLASRAAPVDKTRYYHDKFGQARADAIFARLAAVGQDAGIAFKFGGSTGNTLDSHRLLSLALARDPVPDRPASGSIARTLQVRLAEELFADYFERERDITNHGVLAAAADRAGLASADALSFLQSDSLTAETEAEANASRASGVSGVPSFTINDTYEVDGAQDPAAFLAMFRRLKDRDAKV